jgi:putative ABC transport system substrate-binding protein
LARFVSQLLHGTPPYELPIEQPTSFELVVNERTADGIGLSLPESLLIRIDKVIK